MAKSKAQENAMVLDPQRQMIAKNMSVLPGGPENNNPMNVTDITNPPINSTSVYGDYAQQYAQMGTGMVNPQGVKPSGLQQNFPAGRGQNAFAPYGLQQQPNTSANAPVTDMMESNRIAGEVGSRGLPSNAMGFAGAGPIPAAVDPSFPGSGPGLMQGNPSAEMVPGSTPQKIGQKKKGGKK